MFRPVDAINASLPLLFAGPLVAMFAAAFIYAKGYEGGAGVAEGLRFGILMAVFLVSYVLIGNYVTMNVGRRLSASMGAAGTVE